MVDHPRSFWTRPLPSGRRLGGPAGWLLGLLWSYVWPWEKIEGGPHFIFHSIERLATMRDLDTRTIWTQLKQLRLERLAVPGSLHGQDGFWLFTPPGFEDDGQAPDLGPAEVLARADRRVAERRSGVGGPPTTGDRRSNDRRSPIVSAAEIGDQNGGDRRSKLQRSPIKIAEIADQNCGRKEEAIVKQLLKQLTPPAAEGGETASPASPPRAADAAPVEPRLALAQRLVAEAPCPPGVPPLGPPAARHVLALLDEGWDAELIRRVLLRAPDLIARGKREARFYIGPAFAPGERWEWWRAALLSLEDDEAREHDQRQRAQEQAIASAATDERAQVEAMLDELRARVARPRPLQPFELAAIAFGGWTAVGLQQPERALEAACTAMAAADQAGRPIVAAEIQAAIAAVSPDAALSLHAVREARRRAQAEGREVNVFGAEILSAPASDLATVAESGGA